MASKLLVLEQLQKAQGWTHMDETDNPQFSYEDGVEAALQWVLDMEGTTEPILNDFDGETEPEALPDNRSYYPYD